MNTMAYSKFDGYQINKMNRMAPNFAFIGIKNLEPNQSTK